MAVTLTATQLAYNMRLIADTDETLAEPQLSVVNRVLATATAQVERYAPLAPEAVQNEAAVRLAGFLYDVPPSQAGQFSNPLRQSGAMAVLSSWRTQRAVAVDGSSSAGE